MIAKGRVKVMEAVAEVVQYRTGREMETSRGPGRMSSYTSGPGSTESV